MELYQQFKDILAELSETLGVELKLENGGCSFAVDGLHVINMRYLPESECVALWGVLCEWYDDDLAEARATYLLRLQNLGMGTHGFSVGLDDEEKLLVVHDLRGVEEVWDADHLAAWINDLVDVLNSQGEYLYDHYPADLDYLEEEEGDDDGVASIVFLEDADASRDVAAPQGE